jgi:hypothetical protein
VRFVLTAATHFVAMKSILQHSFPGVALSGFFIARRVFPNPFDEVPVVTLDLGSLAIVAEPAVMSTACRPGRRPAEGVSPPDSRVSASVAAHIRHDQPVKRRPWHTDRARVSRRMGGFTGSLGGTTTRC